MIKPEPGRCNRNTITADSVLHKPRCTQWSLPAQAGRISPSVPRADVHYSRLQSREAFPAPAELNSGIAVTSQETPHKGQIQGKRRTPGAGREQHTAFLLAPEGLYVVHVVPETYSKIPGKNTERLSHRQHSEAANQWE